MALTCRNLASEYWASSEPVTAPSVRAADGTRLGRLADLVAATGELRLHGGTGGHDLVEHWDRMVDAICPEVIRDRLVESRHELADGHGQGRVNRTINLPGDTVPLVEPDLHTPNRDHHNDHLLAALPIGRGGELSPLPPIDRATSRQIP